MHPVDVQGILMTVTAFSSTKQGENESHSVMSNFLLPHGLEPARHLCPWNSPDKNAGVGCHSLLQGTFPTQGPNLHPLCCRHILYRLSHMATGEVSMGPALTGETIHPVGEAEKYVSDVCQNREERGKPAELGQWSKTSQRKGYVSRVPDR